MSRVFDCHDPDARAEALTTAAAVIGRGGLVVMPTDTVYGVGADAFSATAVQALLDAKGRDRQMPPPVLISGTPVLQALTVELSEDVEALTTAFWPGALTVIVWAQPSLTWDLGETGGTVAVRVPDHPLARDLLRATGPMAVSSANLSGQPPAATAAQARDMLLDSVEVYLEEGELAGGLPSTIVDATTDTPTLVRAGGISLADLRRVVPGVVDGTRPQPRPRTE